MRFSFYFYYVHNFNFSLQPTPDTLRADGLAVGTHLLSHVGVEQLVIHGESIGGLAASFTAAKLTESAFLRDKVSLLICDRTFCNLEAVAQRLVGGWSGYAIRMLAPFWNTDVAGSYLSANCPKIVANDCADAIIADSSSLKSGISFWKEVHRGAASTRGVGWIMDTPLEYRMADWENVNVRGKCGIFILCHKYNDLFTVPSTTDIPCWTYHYYIFQRLATLHRALRGVKHQLGPPTSK